MSVRYALAKTGLLEVGLYRSSVTIRWDAANLKVTNLNYAQQFIHEEYRQGWSLQLPQIDGHSG